MTITATVTPVEISATTAHRLQARIDELRSERAAALGLREEATGDTADQAVLAVRDMEVERLDAELTRLTSLLAEARVVDRRTGPADSVTPGVQVRLRFAGDGAEERYLVGTLVEQDDDVTVVTPASPLGRALLGAHVGDEVAYTAPGGPARVAVVGIG